MASYDRLLHVSWVWLLFKLNTRSKLKLSCYITGRKCSKWRELGESEKASRVQAAVCKQMQLKQRDALYAGAWKASSRGPQGHPERWGCFSLSESLAAVGCSRQCPVGTVGIIAEERMSVKQKSEVTTSTPKWSTFYFQKDREEQQTWITR